MGSHSRNVVRRGGRTGEALQQSRPSRKQGEVQTEREKPKRKNGKAALGVSSSIREEILKREKNIESVSIDRLSSVTLLPSWQARCKS